MLEKETTVNQTPEKPSSEFDRKKIGLKVVDGLLLLDDKPDVIMVAHPNGGGIEVVLKEDDADDEDGEDGEGILGVTEEETIMYVDPNGNVTESK